MARGTSFLISLVLAVPVGVHAARHRQRQAANPIRKVVTMLQDMQRKVTAEGEKQQELYEKFMCYCKTSGGSLNSNIEEGNAKISSLSTSVKASSAKKAQTSQDLADHMSSRDQAKDDIAKAKALREKEAAAFTKEESDGKANIAALSKAITALEKGMSGAFLQTTDASALRIYTMEKAELPDQMRQELLAFLSGKASTGYVPKSGDIVGILKQMHDEMSKNLADATEAESDALKSHESLVAAKTKEVAALQSQIEDEQTRVGRLGVEVTSMSNDLDNTQEALDADTKLLAEVSTACGTKTTEWEVIKQTRAEELLAISETIKVLNDDDALELFKKTLPSSSSSFAQIMVNKATVRAKALAVIRAVEHRSPNPELGLLALALSGKKAGFDSVIKMIDTMVANLKTEQGDDDSKKAYCGSQFDATDDKKKGLELSMSDSQTAIDEMQASIATLTEEITALNAGIKALDKSVSDATELRKAEHQDYMDLTTSNANAKEVLSWAKNRLSKFYNPKMYKPPAKRELSEEERITSNFGGEVFAQVHDRRSRLPPPPETFGAYTTKTEESNGVLAMIDLLIKDLDKETSEADVTEKDAQKEYEATMTESSDKRTEDAKLITDKSAAKAAEEEALQAEVDKKAATSKDLAATLDYIHNLHGECDWLMKYYETRKSARASEIDSLGKAKAVLNGADYA